MRCVACGNGGIDALLHSLRRWYHSGLFPADIPIVARCTEAEFETRFVFSSPGLATVIGPALTADALWYVAKTIGVAAFSNITGVPEILTITPSRRTPGKFPNDAREIAAVAAVIMWLDSHIGVEFRGVLSMDECKDQSWFDGDNYVSPHDSIPVLISTCRFVDIVKLASAALDSPIQPAPFLWF